MRVLLANPTPREAITKEGRVLIPLSVTFEPHRFPLSLCLVASAIRARNPGAELRVVDGPAEGVGADELAARIGAMEPDLTVINAASPTLESDLAAARAAAAVGSRVALFGQHAQAMGEELLRAAEEVDVCVGAEPESALAELVAAIAGGGSLDDVPGIVYRDRGGGVRASGAEVDAIQLDALSWPARDLVDAKRYRLPDGERYTLVLAGRGCPFDCPFCLAPGLHGRRARLRTPASIVEEVRAIRREQGIHSFLFQADLFTANRRWVLDLCEELERGASGIRWICNTRIDTIDREMLERMRRAGLFLITFGIESGDPEMLDVLGKGRVTLERIRETVGQCRDLGIKTNGSFVIGHPGESRESLARTRELILSLPLDMAVLMCSTPHPGTPLFSQLAEGAGFLSRDFADYSFDRYVVGGGELSAEEITTFVRDVRRRFYLSPGYFARRMGDLREPIAFARSALFAVGRALESGRRVWRGGRRGRGAGEVNGVSGARMNPYAAGGREVGLS